MLEIKYDDLSNGELMKLRNDADRIIEARCCDAARELKVGSLVTYKQLDGSSHNYLIVDYQEDLDCDSENDFYFFKALHYYISPVGKITVLSTDMIDEDRAATRLRLLDSNTTVTQTDLTEDEYDKRRKAFYLELVEEFTTFSVQDEWR